MHLKRWFKGLSSFSKSSLSVLFVAGIAGGCSSDFSRFTDGIDKSSVQHGGTVQKPAVDIAAYPPAPGNNIYSSKVESSNLAPPQTATVSDEDIGGEYNQGYRASPREVKDMRSQAHALENPEYRRQSPEYKNPEHSKIIYTVIAGDTLSGIALRYNTKIAAIKNENGLKGDKILIGQKLTLVGDKLTSAADFAKKMKAEDVSLAKKTPLPLPEPSVISQNTNSTNPDIAGHKENIQSNSAPEQQNAVSSANVENKNNSSAESAAAAGAFVPGSGAVKIGEKASDTATDKTITAAKSKTAKIDTPIGENSALMIWPVRGGIISSYGQRTGTTTNDGIDIAVPEGTAVKAADDGTVIYAGDGLKEFGNTILIRHNDNIVTVYGHNSKLLVQRGSQVKKGDKIAQSGSSGNASVAKLHFEVRKNSAPVNPMRYLPSIH